MAQKRVFALVDFVVFCRVLSVLFGLRRIYNRAMAIYEPYIPREYLALQINYCKQQLAALPEVIQTKHTIHGKLTDVFKCDSRFISINSKSAKEIQSILLKREQLICELSKLEGIWNSVFRGAPPSDIEPRKITRQLFQSSHSSVKLDGKFFESLKNDADPNYRENKTYYYNGTFYRSASEVDIARFYTEQGIPFKYEPQIFLKGLNYPIYTDFVILIKDLDLCKFHEHFGMKNKADYNRITSTKIINYTGAGLLAGLDIIYTFDTDEAPFDIRSLHAMLNSAVYSSLFIPNTFYKGPADSMLNNR